MIWERTTSTKALQYAAGMLHQLWSMDVITTPYNYHSRMLIPIATKKKEDNENNDKDDSSATSETTAKNGEGEATSKNEEKQSEGDASDDTSKEASKEASKESSEENNSESTQTNPNSDGVYEWADHTSSGLIGGNVH